MIPGRDGVCLFAEVTASARPGVRVLHRPVARPVAPRPEGRAAAGTPHTWADPSRDRGAWTIGLTPGVTVAPDVSRWASASAIPSTTVRVMGRLM